MGFSLITEYPAWFSLFCLAAGAFYAWLMYRRASILNELPGWQGKLMTACRFILVSILCFLLLGPMIRTLTREIEKPIVILALDASQSILNSQDSINLKEQYKSAIEKINADLKSEYEVRLYSFGDHIRPDIDFGFKDKETNFRDLYNELDVQFANRNVGALIIASDGLYNVNDNPVYGPSRLKIPVYTLALGDTTVRKDVFISRVNNNRVAFLGNSFPVEVTVGAHQFGGAKVNLTIQEDSVPVFSRSIDISGNNFHTTIPAFLDAKKKGIRHYKIIVSSLDGEVTYSNNANDIFIEILENKQKILILANAPNPDLSALKNSIESSPNYEVKIDQPGTFNGRISDFNLVIFHNLPSLLQNSSAAADLLKTTSVSTLYILGTSTNIQAFNALGTGVNISQQNGAVNETQALAADEFSLFSLSDNFLRDVAGWPPLSSPFGVYSPNGNIYPLLYQKVGNVATRQPLLFFTEQNGNKSAILAGEGIWKWRMADFNAHGNHDVSDELISKIIQYLSVKENRSPFRVIIKNNFKENEPLIFDAELYNQSEKLINTPEANLTITNNKGQQFPYTFSRTENTYTLNTGVFPVGYYRYKAQVKLGDQLYNQQGEFSVSALQLEFTNTVADHQLLRTLSNRSGASMFYPATADELIKAIKQREDVKSVSYTHKKLEDLINLPLIFVLIILFLSLEWFLRKRAGGY